MYFSYALISKCYSNLRKIAPEGGKKLTERVSALRYLLAVSALLKRNDLAFPVDLSLSADGLNNRRTFIEYVGEVVSLSGDLFTVNFAGQFKRMGDYGTSN